jgi:hypothetical protein
MTAPTYDLKPTRRPNVAYLDATRQLADQVLARGRRIEGLVERYTAFIEATGRETLRSPAEYLLEALTLGVLWRARGSQSLACVGARATLVGLLARERRAGAPRRRDGSNALLLSGAAAELGRVDPSLEDIERMVDWLTACGEYDDEAERLEGWLDFLRSERTSAKSWLRAIVAFAVDFEARSLSLLGGFTTNVHRFLCCELARRPVREDTVQCSRQRIEYHLSMVGAEILNRAWRADFLRCQRHVVVLPGCSRRRPDSMCRAARTETELRCSHCTVGCSTSAATRIAARAGAEAVAVVHGSDFSAFLRSPRLQGEGVGIVGVACAPGLLGAGWRARATGLPAQCVLLDASGCGHWRDEAVPTELDLLELSRIVEREERTSQVCHRSARIAESERAADGSLRVDAGAGA